MSEREGFFPRLNRFFERPARRRAAVIVMVLILAGSGVVSVRRALGGSSEYPGFRKVSRELVLEGKDIYETIKHKRAYPPFFAVAFLPFALGPAALGAILFWLFNAVATVLCPLLLLRALLPRGSPVPFGTFLLLWFAVAGLLFNVLARCESDLVTLTSIVVGFWLLAAKRRFFLAGAVLSVAAAIKLTPVFLGFYLLWRRQWRAFFGMLAGGIFLVVVLQSAVFGVRGNLERHERWWTEVFHPYLTEGAQGVINRPYRDINQSLTAVAYRYLASPEIVGPARVWYPKLVVLPEGTVRLLVRGLEILLLLTLLWFWWGRGTEDSPLLAGAGLSLALIAMLEFSEVSLTGHHAVLLLPIGTVLAFLARGEAGEREQRRVGWGLGIALLLINVSVIRLFKDLSFVFFGTVVLLLVTIHIFVRLPRDRRVECGPQGG